MAKDQERKDYPMLSKPNEFPFFDFPFSNVMERIDQFFTQAFFKPGFKVRFQETEDHYLVMAELPGVKKEDIHIRVLNNQLMIRAKVQEFLSVEDTSKNMYQKQATYREMSRLIPFFHPVYENQIKAIYKDGLLTIRVRKQQGKTIQINDQ